MIAIFNPLNPRDQGDFNGKLLYGTIKNEIITADGLFDSYEAKYPAFPNRSYLAFAVPYQLPNAQFKLVLGVGYQRNER